MRKTRTWAITIAVGLTLAACSTSKPDDSKSAAGPGVTDKTIALGYLTDLSGPASGAGKTDYQGAKLYVNKVNKAGGVCGRRIDLTVQDSQYDPQKALSLYSQTEPKVLGFLSTLGSPILSALGSRYQKDQVLTTTLGWDNYELSNPYYMVVPSTSDMDMVAGLDWFSQQGLLHKGDTIGVVYIEGLGDPQLPGITYAAGKLGLKVRKTQVPPTSSDLTGPIAQFKTAGVKAIVAAGLPTQTASAATSARAAGLDVPILTGPAGFVPQIMKSGAASALTKNLYRVLAWAPFNSTAPAVKELANAFAADNGGVDASDGVVVGWVAAKAYLDIVAKSCDNLSRAGLRDALRKTTALDLGGLTGPLDFSKPGQPAARSFNVLRADASVPGAQRLVSKAFISPPLVRSYVVPTK